MSERVQITMKKALERARKSEEFGQGLSNELDRLFKAGLINLQEDKPEFLANFFTDEEIAAYTTYEFAHLSERGEFAIKRARYLNGSNFDRVARILPELKLYCKKNLPGSKFAPPLSTGGASNTSRKRKTCGTCGIQSRKKIFSNRCGRGTIPYRNASTYQSKNVLSNF